MLGFDSATSAMAALAASSWHVGELAMGLTVGVAVALARRLGRPAGVRLAATAVGGMVVTLVAVVQVRQTIAFALLPGVLAGVGGRWPEGDDEASPRFVLSYWLLAATIACFLYLSLPDTEGAVAALGLIGPVVILEVLAPRAIPEVQAGVEAGGLAGVLAVAFALGGPSFSWTGWWVIKAAVVALAAVALVVSPTGRERRWPGRRRARRG